MREQLHPCYYLLGSSLSSRKAEGNGKIISVDEYMNTVLSLIMSESR